MKKEKNWMVFFKNKNDIIYFSFRITRLIWRFIKVKFKELKVSVWNLELRISEN